MEKLGISLYKTAYPLARVFNISRGSKTEAVVVHCGVFDGTQWGHGAAVPYNRYGETVASVMQQISDSAKTIDSKITNAQLRDLMPAGAARAALDAALWDLRAKQTGKRIWELLDIATPHPVQSSHTTISLDTPEAMAQQTHGLTGILKIKLGGSAAEDTARLRAIAEAAPHAQLIIDPNEGWNAETLRAMLPEISKVNALALEQPLPADNDSTLGSIHCPCPIYADESIHTREDLAKIMGRYQGINIKLGKTGGLTEAMALKDSAKRMGLKIMVGCMVECSLATAPALILAQGADIVELDGPRLLASDSSPPLLYYGDMLQPFDAELWG